MQVKAFFIAGASIFLLCCITYCTFTGDVPPEIIKYAQDWPVANKDYCNTRATCYSKITAQNVANLTVAWTFTIPGVTDFGAAATNPLILGDTVYFQDLKCNVFAIDIATGATRWKKEYNLDGFGPIGPAPGWDKLFVAKGHYAVAALDSASGDELWASSISDNGSTVGTDIQLVAYGNLVYVSTVPGTSSSNFYSGGGVGIIYALDQETGAIVWSFNTVDSEDIWGNPQVNSGGGAWYPPAIDTATGIMYWGIANPGPWPGTPEFPNGSSRSGPNLYTNSMVALDAKTGALQWYTQVRPHDLFDLDFQISPILASAVIDGKNKQIVLGSGKLGKVYAFDRDNGDILWETAVGQHRNDNLTSLPEGTTTVLPGPLGGVETPMAYADGVVYVPVVNLSADYTPTELIASSIDFSKATGELVALDVNNGAVLWDTPFASPNFGAATVVNDVVFTTTFDGKIYAFDRNTGVQLWTYQAGGGINGWPAAAGDTILFPVGLGEPPQLMAFQVK